MYIYWEKQKNKDMSKSKKFFHNKIFLNYLSILDIRQFFLNVNINVLEYYIIFRDVFNHFHWTGARRLTNHRCGSAWKATTVGNSVHYGFVTPGSINFYRLLPNYFFRLDGAAALKLQGLGYGPLTVCYSRTVENPRFLWFCLNNYIHSQIIPVIILNYKSENSFPEEWTISIKNLWIICRDSF